MKKRRKKTVLVTVAIIAGVVVLASIALRLFFTRERLLGIIVPRAEKRLNADIEIGDMGIEFPFGFGVDAEKIRFSKGLQEGRRISFSSEGVVVKASLISLIRRKPRLSRIELTGSRVLLSDSSGADFSAEGLDAVLSLKPSGELYRVEYDIEADSILVIAAGGERTTGAAGIRMRGDAESQPPSMKRANELFPEGELRSEIIISAFLVPLDIPETEIKGTFLLSGMEVSSEEMTVRAGRLKSDIDFRLQFEEDSKIKHLSFESVTGADVEELAEIMDAGKMPVRGSVELALDGSAGPEAFTDKIRFDTEALSLDGRLKVRDFSAVSPTPGPRIEALSLDAAIDETGLEDIQSSFELNGRAFSVTGSMKNIIPALYELQLYRSRQGDAGFSPGEFGKMLEDIDTGSRIALNLAGTAFDFTPFISGKEKDSGDEGGGESPGKDAGFDILNSPAVANPFTVLILESSFITLSLDTLVTPYGQFLEISAETEAENGVFRVKPLQAAYAGGRIETALSADFTDPGSITSVANYSASGIESKKMLSAFTESAGLIHGRFDIRGTGRISLTPHADPLNSLHARADLHSGGGGMNFSKFISPVSAAVGVDLSRYENFKFRSFDGDAVISSGRILIDRIEVVSDDGRVTGSGTVGFNKNLDFDASLIIPPDVQKRMKDLKKLGDIVQYFKDDQGNLVLTFLIGGDIESPSVTLDQSGIKEKAKEKLADEIKKKALKKLKDLF